MNTVAELRTEVGTRAACEALLLSRSAFYRRREPALEAQPLAARPAPPRVLSPQEREEILSVLNQERFCDLSPAEVYATLLDEGIYIASIRTMYRLLGERAQVHERRNQLRHPAHPKPQLVARGPNQVWTWDITKLLGPASWTYYYLYVVIDIYSRYVVGWLVASCESSPLAARLLEESYLKHDVRPEQLTVHADRGSSMSSKTVAQMLAGLGVVKSHSRPRVSNDNPYSESQFKTLKYSPLFPERFDSLQQADRFCVQFFAWYNEEHHHSGLELLTPAQVHAGVATEVLEARYQVLQRAYKANPERFVQGSPRPRALPTEVWINRPERPLLLGNAEQVPAANQFSAHPPLTGPGEGERKTIEVTPSLSGTQTQRSEPAVKGRTRREAGDVTSRNEQNQRLGAAPAAGGRFIEGPLVELTQTAPLRSTPVQLPPYGGAIIETALAAH